MGTGSPVDFTSPAAEEWWREQAKRLLALGVEGIKADDGEGYYLPEDVRFADGRTGAEAAWALGGLHRVSMQRALDEVHPGQGVLFGRSGWTGQHAVGHDLGAAIRRRTSGRCACSWSRRCRRRAAGFSNWSHDVGGYLGHRLVERCPPELLVRWLQFGCFTPLMQAHGRMPQEPWHYSEHVLELYRAYVLLHEQLVPYVRAAAVTAARTGLADHPAACAWSTLAIRAGGRSATPTATGRRCGWRRCSTTRRASARWRCRGETGSRPGRARVVRGGGETVVEAPLERIPVWVRAGSIVVTYPGVARGAGVGRRSRVGDRWWRRCGVRRDLVGRLVVSPTGLGSRGVRWSVSSVGRRTRDVRSIADGSAVAGSGWRCAGRRRSSARVAVSMHSTTLTPASVPCRAIPPCGIGRLVEAHRLSRLQVSDCGLLLTARYGAPTRVSASAPASAPSFAASAIESPRPSPSVNAAANESPQP